VAVTFPAGPVNPELVEPIRSVAAALSRRVIG
jgi:hypothetical protein